MFRTEATLGLIGSIIAIVAAILILIVGLVVGLLLSGANEMMAEFDEMMEEYADDAEMVEYNAAKGAVGGAIAMVIIGFVLVVASVVLGFIGTAKLRKENKKGGILLIIAGGLSLVSLFLGGWWGIVSMVLFLVAGIMALVKKNAPAAPAAPVQ